MTHSSHQLTENVKLLQKVVLVSPDQKVLLVQRSADAFSRPGCWDLPGGNSEWPEELAGEEVHRQLHLKDVSREILEETGLIIDSNNVDTVPIYFDTTYEPMKQMFTILVGWKCNLTAEQMTQGIVLSNEHQSFAWVSQEKASTFDFGFAGGESGFISQILRNAF